MHTSHWLSVPLGEVCLINPRLDPSSIADNNIDVTFVPMASVSEVDGTIAKPEQRLYREVAKGYTSFRDGDVLLAKITPCMENGKAAIARGLVNGLGFGSTEFHVLRPGEDVLSKWVFAFIRQQSFRDAAKANFTGTAGQQRVPADFIKRVHLPLPPLPEQQRIVRILDEAAELRHLRAQADRRTAALVPAIFHEMFGDPATNPKSWIVEPVSSLIKCFQGGRSILTNASSDESTKYRVLKVSAVTWKEFAPDESKPVPPDYNPPAHHCVKQGDLLFSRANTTELVGATTYVFEAPNNLLLPDKLWRFVWHKEQIIEPLYMWSLFLHPSTRAELSKRATGTGGSMKDLSMEKVLSMQVPKPPLPLQQQFAARGAEVRALAESQAASRRRLDDLRQSLLYRAFQGAL